MIECVLKRQNAQVLLLIASMIVCCVNVFAQRSIPELWGIHVHDEAHVLSQGTIDQLEKQLKVHEDSTSNQIAVLIIPSLDGDILEEYSLRVATAWKLGQQAKDNGALLLIAINDHKMRIEVGQGLEGVLTDAISNRIIRNKIAPAFRKNDYDEGVKAGVNAMISAIGGEYAADAEGEASDELGWKGRIALGLFIFIILGTFTFVGIITPGCSGWFLYAFLIPFYALFPMAVVGITGGFAVLVVYVIAFPLLKMLLPKTAWGKKMTVKGSTGRGWSWSSGSGWSGGGWSSGGGGGGFSGGGGSFGGGGSSGSW